MTDENVRDVALLQVVDATYQTIKTWRMAVVLGVGEAPVETIEDNLYRSLTELGADNLARMVVLMLAPQASDDADQALQDGKRGLEKLGRTGKLPWAKPVNVKKLEAARAVLAEQEDR